MPDAAVYGPPSLDKALGSLPVVASFLDQLNVAGIIDELCPIRDVALATHGQVIEAMIANRLTSPTPLVRVIDWARAWAVDTASGSPRRCSTMTGWAGPWMRSPRTWIRSPARSAPGDHPVRCGCLPDPLGHDVDLAVRRLRAGR